MASEGGEPGIPSLAQVARPFQQGVETGKIRLIEVPLTGQADRDIEDLLR
jgi:hypothetical protein